MKDGRHLRLGEAGEEMAAAFLKDRGLTIVERRVRFKRGELDIVARDGEEWVFVEVKTRSFGGLEKAAEALGPGKSRRMARVVKEYVHRHRLYNSPMRCDLVAIDLDGDGRPAISHYPGAIIPD
ncbi:MAG: YraN family protein [Planctomycetota bacterium]|jgi:putative endonuclease|nr:YraN family protein [Planctomycetota bacterium]